MKKHEPIIALQVTLTMIQVICLLLAGLAIVLTLRDLFTFIIS